MNIVIAFMLVFAVIGLIDKILGGRFHLAPEFDRGLELMGSTAIALVGIYCMGIYLSQTFADSIARLGQALPFDPALIVGCLLCPDTGALPVALQIEPSRPVALFCGMIVSTAVGVTVSFQLPVCLNMVRDKKDLAVMMNGLLVGLITILPGILLGGVMLRLPAENLVRDTIPVILLCVLLAVGMKFSAGLTTRILTGFANVVRAISLIFFLMVMAGLFIPRLALVDYDLVAEAFVAVGKMIVVVCGALVFSNIIMTRFQDAMKRVADRLGTNDYAVMGLFLSLTTTLAMIPLFHKMDRRGKLMNAAFCAAGAYVIGGQMAFVSGLTTPGEISAYFAMKIVSGVLAILAVCLIEKNAKVVDKPEV